MTPAHICSLSPVSSHPFTTSEHKTLHWRGKDSSWKWPAGGGKGSPRASSSRALLFQFTELEQKMIKLTEMASPKVCWDEKYWDETGLDGKALTFLVYPQSKVAELDNEEPVACWTVNPSVVKWHRRVDVTCLQALSSRNFLPFLGSLKNENSIHCKLLVPIYVGDSEQVAAITLEK